MLYIPKIGSYVEILTDDEVKDVVGIIFRQFLKSTREILYSKLSEKEILEKLLNCFIYF